MKLSIALFALALVSLPLSRVAAQGEFPSDLRAGLDAFVQERMDAAGIPGLSLVIVRGDEVAYAQGYGYANLEERTPMTACTPVGPGSTLKSLTVLAVMQLVEQGLVDLDAPVATYLPWFATAGDHDASITVRHALGMTSGLLDWMDTANGPADMTSERALRELGVPHSADALERRARDMIELVPATPPGEAWAYSSTGYTLAGLIIETVAGMPYERYMQEHVFTPLGMTATRFGASSGSAQGYLRVEDGVRPEAPLQAAGFRPAGLDVVSSACDYGNYLATLLAGGTREGHSVLSQASIDAMWTPGAPIHERMRYGMGWYVQDWNGTTIVNHGGHAMTSSSAMFVAPEQDVAVAVFANVDDLHVDAIGQAVFEQLTGISAVERRGPSDFEPDRAVWQRYVGTYETVFGDPLRIYVEGTQLMGVIDGLRIGFTLEAFSDTEFVTRSDLPDLDGADAVFHVESDGTVRLVMAGQEVGVKAP